MAQVDVPLRRLKFLETSRRDTWWVQPLVTLVIYTSFVVYVTWALFQGENYHYGNYLSPLYSPELLGDSPHSIFGPFPSWWPRNIIPASPAILILLFPLSFRMSCYFYRGSYYKAFWGDPPNCAVGEPRTSYRGEHKMPLQIMNFHRYALYFALIFVFILSYDAIISYRFDDGAGGKTFGIGVGSLVMTLNAVLIGGYTLGCHSLRHLVGGLMDRFSGRPLRKKTYDCVSCLNRHHPKFAWFSLVWVAFTDIYIRLLAQGSITDFRIL